MIHITRITTANQTALALANEPFPLIGHLVPCYQDGQWSSQEVLLPEGQQTSQTFPDESYQLTDIDDNGFAVGAFDTTSGACLGLAIIERGFFAYHYLQDLKVNQAARGQGVARQLLDAACQIISQEGGRGLYTIAQDNNFVACRFYLGYGFQLGGLDTRVYAGTPQEGKSDLYFYYDC